MGKYFQLPSTASESLPPTPYSLFPIPYPLPSTLYPLSPPNSKDLPKIWDLFVNLWACRTDSS